jgi:anti-sigma regulatory factor (Ser/Thr protein kinase)
MAVWPRRAIGSSGLLHPSKIVEVVAVHTQRAIVFYVRDPGSGFKWDEIPHAAVSNPSETPIAHLELREAIGMRPGGFGILTAKGIVDELIYSELGNEVLLIKHTS